MDAPNNPARSSTERRLVWVEFEQDSEPEPAADPFAAEADTTPRRALKKNGDAMSLSDYIHEASGGEERFQLHVLRERLSGLESRVADTQVMLRRQAKTLRELRIAIFVVLGLGIAVSIGWLVTVVT
jgi:ribosomal protein S12 methylthiotransferase accessory factor YcaO